jgi:hypothetical protein
MPATARFLRLTFFLLIRRTVGISASIARRSTLSSLCANFQSLIQFFDKRVQLFRVCLFRGQLAKLTPISVFFPVGHENTKARAVPYLGGILPLQAVEMEGSYESLVGTRGWPPYEKSAQNHRTQVSPRRLIQGLWYRTRQSFYDRLLN